MRYSILLLPLVWFSSCSLVEDQLPRYTVTGTDVQNEVGGTRVTFTVDSDGEPIAVAGAAFDVDSLFHVTNNQVLADSFETDVVSVLVPGADDGLNYFKAFAAFDNGFYAISESVGFTVVSSGPKTSCNPPDNSLTLASELCRAGSVNTSGGQISRKEQYEVTASCQFLRRNTLKLIFPRNPTSGVYRTVRNSPSGGSRAKEVYATVQVGSSFSTLPEFQEIFVSREGDRTTVTLCDNTFSYVGKQRPLTGRLVFDN